MSLAAVPACHSNSEAPSTAPVRWLGSGSARSRPPHPSTRARRTASFDRKRLTAKLSADDGAIVTL